MRKQVVIIHGGSAYSVYDDFLKHLETVPIEDPLQEGEAPKQWKAWIKMELKDTHEVYLPTMPNAHNAKYGEWKLWFLRHLPFLRDGVVLVGHSLGGYFLAKYLSENTLPVHIRALYLLAAPFQNEDFGGEDGGDFEVDPNLLGQLKERTDELYIFHSKDDPIVPFRHAEHYMKALPEAKLVSFGDKGHYILEAFPELLESIQGLG